MCSAMGIRCGHTLVSEMKLLTSSTTQLKSAVLNRGDFMSQRTFGNIKGYFYYHN